MLPSKPREIDMRKLRRLLLERSKRFETARNLTDKFLELREEAGRLQTRIAQARKQGHKLPTSDDQWLADVHAELKQINETREEVTREIEAFSYVEDLVSYARSLGYIVDTVGNTVRSPQKPNPNPGSVRARVEVAVGTAAGKQG